ncbi:MAG: hypothetical protein IJD96_06545 [Lachnospiraceae bacterium]|nr:hypothetical protein [Lachnospiraceae bacterium]
MIIVDIDELTPCLINTETGDIVETEVLKISRKSFLKKFNSKTGWYVNWELLSKENEIFAVVIKGTVDIQGLVAIDPRRNRDALYVSWMVAAPHNNQEICGVGKQKYYGVGGHLFAVAIQKSMEYGSGGAVFGFANNEERLRHYEKWFHAEHIGILHELHFLIADDAAVKIVEDYNYVWSDDEL